MDNLPEMDPVLASFQAVPMHGGQNCPTSITLIKLQKYRYQPLLFITYGNLNTLIQEFVNKNKTKKQKTQS